MTSFAMAIWEITDSFIFYLPFVQDILKINYIIADNLRKANNLL